MTLAALLHEKKAALRAQQQHAPAPASRVLLLPVELWCSVLSYLHFSNGRNGHTALRLTCRRLRNMMEADAIWRSELVAVLAALDASRSAAMNLWLRFGEYEQLVLFSSHAGGRRDWTWRHAFLHLIFSRLGRCILCCRSPPIVVTFELRAGESEEGPGNASLLDSLVTFPFTRLSVCDECTVSALRPFSSFTKKTAEGKLFFFRKRGRFAVATEPVVTRQEEVVGMKRGRTCDVALLDPLRFLSWEGHRVARALALVQ